MRRYLIVDDNRAFAENLAEILRDEGAEVTVAPGGPEALAQLQRARYDAMLTDMRMPVMSGAQLVHELRRVDPGLPVVMATAYSGDDDLKIARAEGLLALLSKPLDVSRLLHLMGAARRDGLVALVEDDPELSDNLSEALRDKGFTALTAASVLETERLGPVRPFCGIVDLRVPGGPDGEALQRLRARFEGLPILISTAHAEAPPPGPVVELLVKPYPTERLLAAVEALHAAAGARAP